MRFNVVTNLDSDAGLLRDFEFIRAELERLGHQVGGVQFNAQKLRAKPAAVNIFLERVVPELFRFAHEQWVIPNPEWWYPTFDPHVRSISKFLCKTQDSLRLFRGIAGDKAQFLGFMSRDLYRDHYTKEVKFLHVAGNSAVKNTEAIIAAWERIPYTLAIVTSVGKLLSMASKVPHIQTHTRITDEALRKLMNESLFHICPSKYEGFGHYLHEAMGVGAIVITHNGPPMNEFENPPELIMPSVVEGQLRLAEMRGIQSADVYKAVCVALELSDDRLQELSNIARRAFEVRCASFKQTFEKVVTGC